MTQAFLNAYRAIVVALLNYAAPAPNGRGTGDPVYRKIVENRVGPGYSSCGDLAHWLLFRLGVRAPWINRAEYPKSIGGFGWRMGANLNLLTGRGSCQVDAKGEPLNLISERLWVAQDWNGDQTELFATGDIFVVANAFGGHVLCVRGWNAGKLLTTEYGQPGGMPREHAVSIAKPSAAGGRRAVFCGSSQVTYRIRLERALELVTAPIELSCLAGTLAPAEIASLSEALSAALAAPATALDAPPESAAQGEPEPAAPLSRPMRRPGTGRPKN
jgi:hypothetical protein